MSDKTHTNVSFQTTPEFRAKLDALTRASGLKSRSKYIIRVLEKAVADGLTVREEVSYYTPPTPRLTDEAAA